MSQAQDILRHIKAGKSITPIEALREFGCFRLGARIYDLKRDGHTIVTEKHELPSGKRVARYHYVSGPQKEVA